MQFQANKPTRPSIYPLYNCWTAVLPTDDVTCIFRPTQESGGVVTLILEDLIKLGPDNIGLIVVQVSPYLALAGIRFGRESGLVDVDEIVQVLHGPGVLIDGLL